MNKGSKEWLKKLKLKEIRVHMGMFDYLVNVIIGKYKSINEYARVRFEDDKFDINEGDDDVEPYGQFITRNGYVNIIWLPRYPKTPREYATLAHESVHAACALMDWADIKINKQTDEVVAHAATHIINEVLKSRGKSV